ncbi:CoA-transferase [Dankookia rubra]|uniref:CoA-transferase n=1 Tax=Dankookia rubra TaxID=1442381 RepID=UPI0030C89BA8
MVTVNGRPFLLELPLRADFALVRGSLADGMGKLPYNKAARNHCAVMAMAADIVVAEVERIVETGALDPEAIVTPCIFVDRVVSERPA